ncbi:MAG: diguanylate cyclase [Gallionella sp.]|nr:MAG: diguanylate cyclase [Gallionella sp.]
MPPWSQAPPRMARKRELLMKLTGQALELHRIPSPRLSALAAALIVLAVMLTIDTFERKQAMQNQRLYVLERASVLRARLEAAISTPVSTTRAIAVVYAAHPDLPEDEFSILAEQARTSSPGILNIALFRDTVICCVYPRKGNEKLVGLDIRGLPGQWPAYRNMMDTHRPMVAGPLKLVEGGEAVVVRIPAYHADTASGKERFIGAVGTPILFDSLLREAGISDTEKNLIVAIRGRDGRGHDGEIIYGSSGAFTAEPVLQQVALPGGSWEIAAYPRSGWGASSPALGIIRALGGLLCLLAAVLAYMLAGHLRRRAENEQRLHESEAQLKQRSAELTQQNAVLEMITHNAGLPGILKMMVQLVELHHPGALCSIMLLDRDGLHLRHGAAPSLPDFYNRTVDGITIGEGVGCCGTAAYRGERAVIENIQAHPWCENYRKLARQADLQSCWSQPIKDNDGRVLGTFAIYRHHPATPQPGEIALIEEYAALIALVIERTRTAEVLRLHDAALNVAANAIVITDRQARIIWANQAFARLTGYEVEEAIGHHCGSLSKSGHHDRQFYEALWQTILSGHVWHGELVNRRKDGTLYHDETTITPIRGKDGEITHFVAVKGDITARKTSEEHLKNLAFYDPLTQLPNRRLLIDRLGQTLVVGKRSGRYGALMFLDLDNFKPLNDEHGHDVGDLLLIEAAQRISHCVREEDTVARFGGDEFVVMLKDLDADKAVSAMQANGVAEKIRAALAEPYRLELLQAEDGETVVEHRCTSSIGIVLFVNQESDRENILRWADIAMYKAKAGGRNRICFYEPV